MRETAVGLETALRVLMAIVGFADPDPDDVAELRRLLPDHDEYPLDEVARIIIQRTAAERLDHRGNVGQDAA